MGILMNAGFSKLLLISLFRFIIVLLSILACVCVPIWKQCYITAYMFLLS